MTDFHELNKCLVRKPYPMPRIQDTMQKRGKYKYFTKINLSMCFYCYELEEESKHLMTAIHPYGTLLEYNCLAMGLKVAPDIAQVIIKDILKGLGIVVYIDDIGIWTDGSYEDHLKVVNAVLR